MANEILNIRPVVRGRTKVIIGIAGESGSGKTFTALKIARGMVEKPEEIGFLDTENGRGSLYDNILDGRFLIGDLYPPFSPSRYAAAIKQFQSAGVKVLVIDSVSHEWEGEGGCDRASMSTNEAGDPARVETVAHAMTLGRTGVDGQAAIHRSAAGRRCRARGRRGRG